MLNEDNDNPGQDDSWLAKEVTAAMHDYAGSINHAPPLRLAPRLSLAWPQGQRGAPRWQAWLVPVTVAAVIVSLAVSLVLVRNLRNGSAVSGTGTSSATGGPASTASATKTGAATAAVDSVPRYYLAIQFKPVKAGGNEGLAYSLVAGDTRTGKQVASVPAPGGIRFMSVAAAGDDRTFVAAGQIGTGGTAPVEFFQIRLTPGAAHPAQVTLLPIKRQVFGTANSLKAFGDGYNVALSSSGQYLAVTDFSRDSGMAVHVFSVATGKLVREWTTTAIRSGNLSTLPTLTWADGDQELALATLGAATKHGTNYVAWQNVRVLQLLAPGSDLVKDSTLVRHALTGAAPGSIGACGYQVQWPPVISANGKTFTCTTGGDFLTFPLKAGSTGIGAGLVDLKASKNDFVSNVLWVSKTGSTQILEWGLDSDGLVHYGDTKFAQVDVVSHGKAPGSYAATQLHFPKGFGDGLGAQSIAW